MWTDEQRQLAKKLLNEARVTRATVDWCKDDDKLLRLALYVAADIYDEYHVPPPSQGWFYNYHKLSGAHMVLTDIGWISADRNTPEATNGKPKKVISEVNGPDVSRN